MRKKSHALKKYESRTILVWLFSWRWAMEGQLQEALPWNDSACQPALFYNSHPGEPLASQQLLTDHMSRIPCSFNGCICGLAGRIPKELCSFKIKWKCFLKKKKILIVSGENWLVISRFHFHLNFSLMWLELANPQNAVDGYPERNIEAFPISLYWLIP